MHSIRVRPAIRVGWGKETVDPKVAIAADIGNPNVIWDAAERQRFDKVGARAYVDDYFCFLKNNGKYGFFVYDHDEKIGFALTRRSYRTGKCTFSAVHIIDECCSPKVLREVASLLVSLIPADWVIHLSKRALADSWQFWNSLVAENTGIDNLSRTADSICFRSRNRAVSWEEIFFGVEVEFFGVAKKNIKLPANWNATAEEWLFADNPFERSYDGDLVDEDVETLAGAEVRTPPLQFSEIDTMKPVLANLKKHGGRVNYSCALHIHVGMFHWGYDMIARIVKNLDVMQDTIISLVQPSAYRSCFCEKYDEGFATKYFRQRSNLGRYSLVGCTWQPFLRYGISLSAFWDRTGTIEIRFANGSLDYQEIKNTVQLYVEMVAELQKSGALSEEFLSTLKATKRTYPPAREVPENCTAIFPLMYRLRKNTIFSIFDEHAEYGEAYVGGVTSWLEKSPGSIIAGKKDRLVIRYRLSGRTLITDVFLHAKRIHSVKEKLSRRGVVAVSQFIEAHGGEEPIWVKRVQDQDYDVLANAGGK